MRMWLAIRMFFKIVGDGDFAARVRRQLDAGAAAPDAAAPLAGTPAQPAAAARPPAPPAPVRNDAITLLAALQREARLVDIVQESLDGYSDAQVGAAARDVLRDSRKVLDRLFALRPVAESPEGEEVTIPAGYDAGKYRLTGDVAKQPPLSGQVVHAGWQAAKCELPAWTGSREAALVVAPAEVQVR
ncbi:MAG: DUF2760 domain-containing protein [Planctomycetota bacterium]|nr:MAG: DUF2760 domain-containing protein [Planctomycetota bacterium]